MKHKILVVDDDWDIRFMLKKALEVEDFEVWEARDGQEAIDKVQSQLPDLIILDVNLPKKNGYEVCRHLRKMGVQIPIIMLTCQTQTHHRVTGLESGADDYVPKPFSFDELLARIRAQLRRVNVAKSQAEKLLKDKWEEINEGLRLAQMLQQPFFAAPQIKNIEVSVHYFPVGKIGGDFYNLIPLDENRTAILIGDALGKGLGASFVMAFAFSLLNRLIRSGFSPKEVLNRANKILGEDLRNLDTFVSTFCMLWDRRNSTITFSSAGHLPPILISRETLKHQYLQTDGLFLGAFDDGLYQERTLRIYKGDRLFFYTDGIMELTNQKGEQFKIKVLYRTLLKNFNLPVKELSRYMMTKFKEFVEDNVIMKDDVTFLLLELH